MSEQPAFEIHKAAMEGNLLIVQGLLEQDPKLALQKDLDSRTPLHWACSMQKIEIAKLLLNPFQLSQNTSNLSSENAASLDSTRKTVKKFDIDIDEMIDESGWTPLHISASIGNLELIILLMDHKPTPDIDLQTGTGQTCLHYAVSKNHYDVVEYLINECKASARIKDKKSQYPLHRAAAIGSIRMCETLIDVGKSPLNAKDAYGFTPMHHAMVEGHGDVAALLVKRGADYQAENSDSQTPLDVALNDKVKQFFANFLKEEGLE